jgi:hypothetical protein
MTMKDDLRRARAAELRSAISRLQREASQGSQPPQGETARSEPPLLGEILEAVGQLQEEMEDVLNRLAALENQGGQSEGAVGRPQSDSGE